MPDSLKVSKPEAYCPQVVGLGLLHHNRFELESMHMYKVGVARKIHKGFGRIEFGELIYELKQLVPSVRACYRMYLKANDFEIAYAMAIDALFLFELLCYYGIGKDTLTSSNILRDLVATAGMRLAKDGILRDTLMLENQIPIVVLKNILFIECSEPNSSHVASKKKKKSPIIEKYLPHMLWGYCKALSPFNLLENYPASIALEHAHMLDLLYHLIMLKEPPEEMAPGEEEGRKPVGKNFLNTKFVKEAAGILLSLDIPKDIKKPIELLKGLLELPCQNLIPTLFKNIVHVEKRKSKFLQRQAFLMLE